MPGKQQRQASCAPLCARRPQDPLQIVLQHADGLTLDENDCIWFQDYCNVDANTTVFRADTTVMAKRAESVRKTGRPVAASLSCLSRSDSSASEDDDGDPWLLPKSKERLSVASSKPR